jgi:hypothetical protein
LIGLIRNKLYEQFGVTGDEGQSRKSKKKNRNVIFTAL